MLKKIFFFNPYLFVMFIFVITFYYSVPVDLACGIWCSEFCQCTRGWSL